MSVTIAEVTARFPEFISISDTHYFNQVINHASLFVDPSTWGNRSSIAIVLYTAHLLELDKRSGDGSSSTSVKIGDMQKNYGNSNPSGTSNSSVGSTKYGAEFIALRKSIPSISGPFII